MTWIPGLIPTERKGRWKVTAQASSAEIEGAIEIEAQTEGELARKRWIGLHFAYVRALGREHRQELAVKWEVDEDEGKEALAAAA